jgi:hypothetical protein
VFKRPDSEVLDALNSQISTLNTSRRLLSSVIITIWAIGTSAAAGALSA